MNHTKDIILILDSILDDYYLLWECFAEYNQYRKEESNLLVTFFDALKEAYENKYLNFFSGIFFDGDEVLIPDFSLTTSVIQELLNFENKLHPEIRITTSSLGLNFLKSRNYPN